MGKIKVTECGGIKGLKVVEPTVFGDARGYFMETYNYNDFKEAGIDVEFVQDNQSSSHKGVLRGLHFQINYPQDKLVRVVSGEVFDVAVDLREDSETYGKWFGVVLSAENKKQFFIPKGFAHGFLVLSEHAEFVYKYGADGILMGTRFVVTEECDAPDGYKQLYLNCRKNDVTIIRSPMKTSVRTMRTAFSEKIAEDGEDPYDLFEAVRRSVAGDPDSGLVFCSENAGLADKIDTVKDVFREFTTQKK